MISLDHTITSDIDRAWRQWEADCDLAWELKAQELVALGYAKIPDKFFGAVFEKDGGQFYLGRDLGTIEWRVIEFTKRDEG